MKYPFIKQNGLNDCGPACLAMIIKYYKGYIPLDTLIQMTNTKINGTSAYDLQQTANKIGFQCNATTNINTYPCIALIKQEEGYNHYIVVYKKNKDNYVIADPSTKIKIISQQEFEKRNLKVLLNFTPIKKIIKIKEHNITELYKKVLSTNKKHIISIISLSILYLLLMCLYVLFYQKIITQNNSTLTLLFIFISIFLIQIIVSYIKNYQILNLESQINQNLLNDIVKKIILLPYVYFKNHTTGEIISRLNDTSIIKESTISIITEILNIPLFLIFIILMLILNKKLTILTLILILIYYIYNLIYQKYLNYQTNEFYRIKETMYSFFTSTIMCYEYFKGCNTSFKMIKHNCDRIEDFIKKQKQLGNIYNKKNIINSFIIGLGEIFIIYFGIKELTIQNLIIYMYFYSYITTANEQIIYIISQIKQANISYKRIYEFDIEEKHGNINKITNYDITANNLYFSYGYKEILNNLTISIKHNQKVLIYGKSGSGKSTFVKILKGYLENNKLKIGDNYVNSYSIEALNKIIYVGNDEPLFNGTIRSNLMCDDEILIKKYASLFELQSIGENQIENLDTLVLENGFNISQGQRQQVVLLRAILNPFEILIIDEGTSQMDVKLEQRILERLFNQFKEQTIIVISHRLDNKHIFDKVINIAS